MKFGGNWEEIWGKFSRNLGENWETFGGEFGENFERNGKIEEEFKAILGNLTSDKKG